MLGTPQQVALMTLGVKGFAIVSKSSNLPRHQLNSTLMVQFCFLRLCLDIETFSCRLLLRIARIDMD